MRRPLFPVKLKRPAVTSTTGAEIREEPTDQPAAIPSKTETPAATSTGMEATREIPTEEPTAIPSDTQTPDATSTLVDATPEIREEPTVSPTAIPSETETPAANIDAGCNSQRSPAGIHLPRLPARLKRQTCHRRLWQNEKSRLDAPAEILSEPENARRAIDACGNARNPDRSGDCHSQRDSYAGRDIDACGSSTRSPAGFTYLDSQRHSNAGRDLDARGCNSRNPRRTDGLADCDFPATL